MSRTSPYWDRGLTVELSRARGRCSLLSTDIPDRNQLSSEDTPDGLLHIRINEIEQQWIDG